MSNAVPTGDSNPAATGPVVPRDQWLNFVVDAYEGRASSEVPSALLPGFPPDELQITTTSEAGGHVGPSARLLLRLHRNFRTPRTAN
jgi:hypothetical protein